MVFHHHSISRLTKLIYKYKINTNKSKASTKPDVLKGELEHEVLIDSPDQRLKEPVFQ